MSDKIDVDDLAQQLSSLIYSFNTNMKEWMQEALNILTEMIEFLFNATEFSFLKHSSSNAQLSNLLDISFFKEQKKDSKQLGKEIKALKEVKLKLEEKSTAINEMLEKIKGLISDTVVQLDEMEQQRPKGLFKGKKAEAFKNNLNTYKTTFSIIKKNLNSQIMQLYEQQIKIWEFVQALEGLYTGTLDEMKNKIKGIQISVS